MSEKKLNVAIIGCGSIAKNHCKGVVAKEECHLYALCDNRDDDRIQQLQAEFGGDIMVKDYRELLNDPKIDIAIVTTSDESHCEITCAFLRAGKHVLLEKPMALHTEECLEMIKAEKESGMRLMVGQVARYSPVIVRARQMVAEGCIGELVYVESEYAHCYEKHRGYKDWRINPSREGVIGGGCHAIDLLRSVAGDPLEVHAFSNHKILTEWPVNDSTIAIYKFPNNVLGKVFCSIGAKRKHEMRTSFFGTKGTLSFSSKEGLITLYAEDENGGGYTTPQMVTVENNVSHNMTAEISDFVDAILNDKPTPISSREGLYTVTVCRATVNAADSGETVKIVYPEV